jgi:hypothetical protein
MKLKADAGHALLEFIQDIGVPSALHTDNAKEMTSGKWETVQKDHQIKQTLTERHSTFQNRAEIRIREVKKHVHRIMNNIKAPKHL